jgi:hypothetical protein
MTGDGTSILNGDFNAGLGVDAEGFVGAGRDQGGGDADGIIGSDGDTAQGIITAGGHCFFRRGFFLGWGRFFGGSSFLSRCFFLGCWFWGRTATGGDQGQRNQQGQ